MDHTDAALRAVVKTLRDVVAPALDPADPLAHEQLRLAVDYLEFLRGRFEWLHGRERFDLTHHLDMARAMCRIGGPVSARVATALAASIDRGERVIVDGVLKIGPGAPVNVTEPAAPAINGKPAAKPEDKKATTPAEQPKENPAANAAVKS